MTITPPNSSGHRWSGRLWVPAVTGLMVLGLLFGLFLLRGMPADTETRREKPLLLRAATALEARDPAPVRIPRPDEWLFIRTARDWVEGRDMDRDEWRRADNQLGALLESGKIRTFDDEGVPWTTARVFPNLVAAYEFYADLPDDPAAVRQALYDLVDEHDLTRTISVCNEKGECESGETVSMLRPSSVFLLVNSMLSETTPPPAVTAKLYRALAGVRGVENAGTIVDMTGKRTAAVRWQPPPEIQPNPEVRDIYHILLDAETYAYRGDYFTGETFGFRDDGITGSDIILSAGFVDEVGEYPPITDRPEFPRILHRAADRLAAADTSTTTVLPRPDQWRYLKLARAWADERDMDREQWIRADFTRTAESVDNGPVRPLDEVATEGLETVVFADLAEINVFYGELPDDPEAALEAVYAKVGDDDRVLSFACHSPRTCAQLRKEGWARHAAAYELIQRLLYVSTPPPQVQAKLVRVLAVIPGVDTRGIVDDATGSPALAIVWLPPVDIRYGLGPSRRIQILVDADTYGYRGYREFEWGGGEAELIHSYAVLATGFVDEAGGRP